MRKKFTAKEREINMERHRVFKEMNIEDFDFLLKHQVRRVRWLHANSNRNTFVYDEKLVRTMVQKLQNRVKELESELKIHNE
jgi:hypothetical protein